MIGILKIGPIMALSVSAKFLLLPISCTNFNNVGVSQKSAKIAQKMLVNKTLKLNPICDYQSIILCL